MPTTIQLSKATKQTLEEIKRKEKARSYDQVIRKLVQAKMKTRKSMFGAAKGLRWEKEDRIDFHEL